MSSICLKNLPLNVTINDIKSVLSSFGSVEKVEHPRRKRFAFVRFSSEDEAQSALQSSPVFINDTEVSIEVRTSDPRPRKSKGTTISITSASGTALNMDSVREACQAFGSVDSIKCNIIVTFSSAEGADSAESEMTDVLGEQVVVSRVRDSSVGSGGGGGSGNEGESGKHVPDPNNSVYVRNFNPDTTEDDIREAFGRFGEIVSVILRVKGTAEEPLTWAFVEYAVSDSVSVAVATMNGASLNGQEIVCEPRSSQPVKRRGRPRRYRN